MKISIFGMGYVGIVSAALLAKDNEIIGVDVNPVKLDSINKGISPIIEKDVDLLISAAVKNKHLKATDDAKQAILDSDISIISVGTPSNEDGSHNLSYLDNVIKQISETLKQKTTYHFIVIRSTIPPGTTEQFYEKYLKGLNAGICFNPEFLREGSAVSDYLNPPYIIAACNDKKAEGIMRELYKGINGEFISTSFKEAEILKMVNNAFHALKVTFANEIGRFCEVYNIDGKKVMDLVKKDKKLNISEKYLTPGFAYGGSCLPKDLRSFIHLAKGKNIKIPLITSLELSNEEHVQHAIKNIEKSGSRKIGVVGLSFKPGTDDLRESPYVKLVEYLIGKGYDLKIYDPNVSVAKLVGANKSYIEKEIPHISKLLTSDIKEVMKHNLIILNHTYDIKPYLEDRHTVIDLR
jgi:GDP-mannose 6-dehydrogenase